MENEFKRELNEYLKRLNKDIEEILLKLINYDYPREVVCLEFEVFSDSFTVDFPVRAFFMDKDNCEYFIEKDGKYEYPSPVDPDLLDIDGIYPYEFEEKFTDIDSDFDTWGVATDTLIEWFSERWNNCGGKNFKLKASIAHHDSSQKYDLVNQKWSPH